MDDAEVWRGIFDAEYESLQREAERLARIERVPENFDEIAAASARLDERRRQSRKARRQIVSRYEAPAPDIVAAPRGTQDTGRASKALATLSVVLLVVVAWMGYVGVRNYLRPYPVTIQGVADQTVDLVGGRCVWSFNVLVDNGFEDSIDVTRFLVVLDRGSRPATMSGPTTIAASSVGAVPVSFRLRNDPNACPAVDEISHGLATVEFNDGTQDTQNRPLTKSITGRF